MRFAAAALVVSLATAPAAAPPAFDLTGAKADRVFFVLGMLFEYGGAPVLQGDTIQTLFCNEREIVPLFTRVLRGLAQEQGLPADLTAEPVQSCLTRVSSPVLAARLAAFYPRPRPAGSIDRALFGAPGQPVDRRRALAYVAGAWARYRQQDAIVLTAGKAKADLIAELLKALGCTNVRVETSVGYVPGASTVHFEPTADVSEWLRKPW